MKLKREFFNRGVRMQHRFGEELNRDPVFGSGQTFDAPQPIGINKLAENTRSLNIQRDGQYRWDQPTSPIIKPNGRAANTNGPAPDYAYDIAAPIPSSTKKRRS